MVLKFEPYTIYSNNGRRDIINATSFQGACDALGRKECTFGYKGIDNRYEWDSKKQCWTLKKASENKHGNIGATLEANWKRVDNGNME